MIDPLLEQKTEKLHEWNIIPKKTAVVCDVRKKILKEVKPVSKVITWNVSDLAKAGRLLTNPPLPTDFADEQEMRRVYTLIYDVFRYRSVLNEALDDISFFQLFPKLNQTAPHVWLLFYDLYHREFKKRETAVAATANKLLTDANMIFAENALFSQKVKLAAAVSRLRIRHNALTLSDLLPPHLKDERVTRNASKNPVTCWVNIRKVESPEDLCNRIERIFKLTMVNDINKLGPTNFKWDKHCPQIIAFHSSMRTALARSQFIRSHELVVQDKSFCLGPATFGKIVADLQLSGSVIQTHINSPRSTAYLATILSQNDKIKKLLAFSAGKRKAEYEDYFDVLGMNNVVIFSDKLIDISPDSSYMEEVVAVFATPPNSYSAVNDPIDLVCSRGGDLSMLEILTETEETREGKERVANILEEQRKTLRFAMSRPQIQFVLYETHSELETENQKMVNRTVKEMNKIAKIHHAALQGRIIIDPLQAEMIKEINNNESSMSMLSKVDSDNSVEQMELRRGSISLNISDVSRLTLVPSDDKIFEDIVVPDTDLFDTPDLPSLCPNEEPCVNLANEGCYLALLQRKQVIRLDNKYMIMMAEQRGLFGSTNLKSTKGTKGAKKKSDKPSTPTKKAKKRINTSEDEDDDDDAESQDLEEKYMIPMKASKHDLENVEEKNVVVKYLNPKRMLGHMSVYQLRELVSASFKGQVIYKRNLAANKANKDTISVSSKSTKSSKASSHIEKRKRDKRIPTAMLETVVKRLRMPTQASILKSCDHESEEPNTRVRKSAMEYATREFICEKCKRRNSIREQH